MALRADLASSGSPTKKEVKTKKKETKEEKQKKKEEKQKNKEDKKKEKEAKNQEKKNDATTKAPRVASGRSRQQQTTNKQEASQNRHTATTLPYLPLPLYPFNYVFAPYPTLVPTPANKQQIQTNSKQSSGDCGPRPGAGTLKRKQSAAGLAAANN